MTKSIDRTLLSRRAVLQRAAMGSALLGGLSVIGGRPTWAARLPGSTPSTEMHTIRMSNTPDNQSPTDFVTVVADTLGLYEQYGVDLEIVDGTTASLGPLFLTGGLDVLLHGSALFNQALAGQDVRIVAGIGSKSPFALVTRSDIETIEDVAGQSLGVQSLTGSIYEMGIFLLEKAGVPASDVNFVAIAGQPNILQALSAGRIQAALLPWQYAYLGEEDPNLHILNADPTAGGFRLSGYRFAGVNAAWAADNPEAVQSWVTALIAATRSLASDEELYRSRSHELFGDQFSDELLSKLYAIKEQVGYWSVNGGLNPEAINGNLEYYREAVEESGDETSPAEHLVDVSYAKAALDTLGGPIESATDAAAWY